MGCRVLNHYSYDGRKVLVSITASTSTSTSMSTSIIPENSLRSVTAIAALHAGSFRLEASGRFWKRMRHALHSTHSTALQHFRQTLAARHARAAPHPRFCRHSTAAWLISTVSASKQPSRLTEATLANDYRLCLPHVHAITAGGACPGHLHRNLRDLRRGKFSSMAEICNSNFAA